MQLLLIGYMGSGKSTIGRMLAAHLKLAFYDLDEQIEKAEKKTITQLFEDEGQLRFRQKEHHYLKEIIEEKKAMVLATGGGAPCYANNMKAMLEATPFVFYLQVSIPELVKRLTPEKSFRPLIAHLEEGELPEFLGKHLFERAAFYTQANYTIHCDGKSADEITREIASLLV